MNDFVSLLARRRSVNPLVMHGPGPTPDDISVLLKVAARVPDHGKIAPWRFIVFSGAGRERAGEIVRDVFLADNAGADAMRREIESKRMTRAPLVIAVVSRPVAHPKVPEWEQVLSAGAVCMNLVVAANAMGFVSSWLTEWYAYDRRVLERFGIGADEKVAGFIHIGRSHTAPEDRVRPDMDRIVMHFV